MGLVATSLQLTGFRSFGSFEVEPDPALTVLVGPNAVGKTNVIEALQLLTAAESFRKPQWNEVIRWGSAETLMVLTAEGEKRSLRTELRLNSAGKREYRVNGKVRRRVSDVAGILPCVLFTPDDLRLIKDSAEKRRSALDSLGAQLSPSYRALRAEYERVVRQRNAALRSPGRDLEVIDALTSKSVEVGSGFMAARMRLFLRLKPAMSELYENLSHGETLEVTYLPSWGPAGEILKEDEVAAQLERAFEKRRLDELARGTTLVGPHRDDIVFEIDGRDARAYSSQGQQRTATLAWKLAEVSVIKEVSGQSPLLLLDDVMSELDEERRHSLASFVGGAAQTFMTTTNLGYFDKGLVERAKIVKLA